MIITYRKHNGQYNCLTVVPEGTPWRLETAVMEAADRNGYALRLIVEQKVVDTLLQDDDYRELSVLENGEDMILALFNNIADLAAQEMEKVLSSQGRRLDLNGIIEKEVEFWCQFQEAWKVEKGGRK